MGRLAMAYRKWQIISNVESRAYFPSLFRCDFFSGICRRWKKGDIFIGKLILIWNVNDPRQWDNIRKCTRFAYSDIYGGGGRLVESTDLPYSDFQQCYNAHFTYIHFRLIEITLEIDQKNKASHFPPPPTHPGHSNFNDHIVFLIRQIRNWINNSFPKITDFPKTG